MTHRLTALDFYFDVHDQVSHLQIKYVSCEKFVVSQSNVGFVVII